MCIPGVNSSDNEATFASVVGGYALGKAFEPLGTIGGHISEILAADAKASDNDWIAHSRSDEVQLTLKHGNTVNTVTINAAEVDPAVLAAYGLSYTSADGVLSTRSIFDSREGVLSGPDWTLQDGVLAPPPIGVVPGSMVELPEGAVALAGSIALLTRNPFPDLVGRQAPDERLAQNADTFHIVVPAGVSDQEYNEIVVAAIVARLAGKLSAGEGPSGTGSSSSGASFTGDSSDSSAGDSSDSSNSHAKDLAAERARAYSKGVAQADAAQQTEYAANRAAKDAANQSRIDQNMSQTAAADAQPDPGVSEPDSPPGYFSRQGLFKDGRWFPNVIKPITQDLWTGWGKSSGAEAVIMFPSVLAMAGALFLPQAINDIPNIPTLLTKALGDWDNGHLGDAVEAAGDGLGALGIAGELGGGLGALGGVGRGVGEAAAETMDFSMPGGRLGGKLYPRAELPTLKADLASRGIELRVGSKFVPKGASAAFNGVERIMVFRENPTIMEIEHEIAHLEHFEKIGAEAYNNRELTTRLIKEQFVFDKLSGSDLWETFSDKERFSAVGYIEDLGGTR